MLSSCAAVGTQLGQMAVGFQQGLVGTAQSNYGQDYSRVLADLIAALAYKELGINQPGQQYPQTAQAGGSYPGGGYYGQSQGGQGTYQGQQAYGSTYGNQASPQYPVQSQGGYNDPYASQQQGAYSDPYASPSQGASNDPYANQGQSGYNDPYANQQGTYSDPYAGQGASQGSTQGQGGYNDPYANQSQGAYNDPYSNQGQGNYSSSPNQYQRSPGETDSADSAETRAGPQTIDLTAALLAQRQNADGTFRLEPVADGAVLHSSQGDPAAGDRLKILFSVDCACFVYIIGIDATGFIAKIFPESTVGPGNPVEAGRKYLLPEGDEWWGLDQYRGIEQVYFVASFRQRTDIESLLASLPDRRPGTRGDGYQPVSEPTVIPVPKGLIKVQDAAPVSVSTSSGASVEVSPTSFAATVAGADLVVTRWFRHD